MRVLTPSLLLVAGLVTLAAPAFAQSGTVIDNRQTRQEQRIDQGISSGTLNGREAARLERGQARVERYEDRALANDGKIGPREGRGITHAQNVQSRRIFRQKHDRQLAR